MTAKFAMISYPYSCTQVGVVFVNSCPVITNAASKKRMAMSLFSDWISDGYTIHGAVGYKIAIVSMASNADKSLSDAVSSCRRMYGTISLTRCKNPAAISRSSP